MRPCLLCHQPTFTFHGLTTLFLSERTANAVLVLAMARDTVESARGLFAKIIRAGYCAVLTHCINPDCRAALRSFAEGRLFQFEVVSISVAACDDAKLPFDEKPKRQTSHFWLCGPCASSYYVTLEPVQGLQLTPLDRGRAVAQDGAALVAQSHPSPQMNHC